jgi:hypothetical protein
MMKPNIEIRQSGDAFLITADASRPAPEFAELLHRLANPPHRLAGDPVMEAAWARLRAYDERKKAEGGAL